MAHQARFHGAIVVVLCGDEATAHTFLSVFPLVFPAVCDGLGVLAQEIDVRQTPSALLFDLTGQLIRREHPIMHSLEEFIVVPVE